MGENKQKVEIVNSEITSMLDESKDAKPLRTVSRKNRAEAKRRVLKNSKKKPLKRA